MKEMTEPEAQAAYDAAVARFDAARLEVEAARCEMLVLQQHLYNARVRADKALPQATMTHVSSREKVAIVRRTKARITVRRHGVSRELVFRLSKARGACPAEWVISPAGKMRLEINE